MKARVVVIGGGAFGASCETGVGGPPITAESNARGV